MPETDKVLNPSRDDLEKFRLAHRKEGFLRYNTPNDIVKPDTRSAAYADEPNRFFRDTAQEEKDRRDAQRWRKEDLLELKRIQSIDREEQRWENIALGIKRFDEQTLKLQKRDLAKRNANSVQYNPITLKYYNGKEAAKMKEKEQRMRERAVQRSEFMYTKFNGKVNILTGQPKDVPQKGLPPIDD
mmetsp:Transcript_41215/g.66841  ORF Transcript_41215/g.66841 Transcript_41215/m.66841 type:complete len:186 (-) Transcript_41215:351-908(-)